VTRMLEPPTSFTPSKTVTTAPTTTPIKHHSNKDNKNGAGKGHSNSNSRSGPPRTSVKVNRPAGRG
jgi:hypothetical protein